MVRYAFDGGIEATLHNPISFHMETQGQGVDRFGNLWLVPSGLLFDGPVQCLAPDGTVLQSLTRAGLIDDICTFALANQVGTSWLSSGFSVEDSGEACHLVTEGGESYLIFAFTKMQNSGTLLVHNGVAVFQPDASGALTLLGVAWTFMSSFNSQFETAVYKIDLCGQKTLDDPIFVAYGLMSTVQAPFFRLWPSVNEIIAQAASGVNMSWYGFPGTVFNPGDTYYGFGVDQSPLGVNAGRDQTCFVMPNDGATDLLIYVSKSMMGATAIPFVVSTLKPTYPDGCLVRTALPAPSYAFTTGSLAAPGIISLPTPAAVPGAFVDAAGDPYDAFTDVGLYYGGAAGAGAMAEYFAVPRILEREADGRFVAAWYHPWFQDLSYTPGTNWTFKARLRLQRYDPATGLFTDLQLLQGALGPIDDIGPESSFGGADFMDVMAWMPLIQDGVLSIWHTTGPSATGSARQYTWRAGIGRVVRRMVRSQVRIGLPDASRPF